jgi:hypothetical protein
MLNLSIPDFRARYTPLVLQAVDAAFARLHRDIA